MNESAYLVALDECLDDIAAGRATAEECVARWPQYREELGPLLEAATEVRSLAVAAAPDPLRRAQFMAALRETPQQPRRRFAIPRPWARRAMANERGGLQLGPRGLLALPALAAAVIAFVVLMAGTGSQATKAATLTVFEGGVERTEGARWAAVRDGARISEGDHVRTGAQGRALLTFADGTTVGLDPDTDLTIERSRVDGTRSIELRQASGRLWNSIARELRENASYVVRTPDAAIFAQGTVFETAVDNGRTAVATAEGFVEVAAGTERKRVAAGESARVSPSGIVVERVQAASGVLTVSVDAPFVAALVAPDGRATGARPDGILYNQIPGAITSDPSSGAQQVVYPRPAAGDYTLMLRRISAGGGMATIAVNGVQQRVALPEVGEIVRVGFTVAAEGERVSARVGSAQVVGQDINPERLVVPEQQRDRSVDVADQRARNTATASPTSAPGAVTPGASTPSAPGTLPATVPGTTPAGAAGTAQAAPVITVAPATPRPAGDDDSEDKARKAKEEKEKKEKEENEKKSNGSRATATPTSTPRNQGNSRDNNRND